MRLYGPLILGVVAIAAALTTGLSSYGARLAGMVSEAASLVRAEPPVWRELSPGWRAGVALTLPEPVNALMTAPPGAPREFQTQLYVGTSRSGSIYRSNPDGKGAPVAISRGLGDSITFGESNVNRLALHDLDGDGTLDLLGSTSQIDPRGRPRLQVWSSAIGGNVARALARPDIASSWSHSLAFVPRAGAPDSAFITFCGHGEIVEYRLDPGAGSADGFRHVALSWKKVGQLPASGEWIEAGDVDGDGQAEICVATGYAPGAAAIHVYRSPAAGAPLEPRQVIDEGRRFGNVRFTLLPADSEGGRRLVAWWCTDLAGGDAEMIVYRLGPEGVRERRLVQTGPADVLWPDDGHYAVGDLDGDGRPELWFAGVHGVLWRFDFDGTEPAPAPRRVATFRVALGQIAFAPPIAAYRRARLYIGCGRSVVYLESTGPAA